MDQTPVRRLRIAHIYNLRDLGGYCTANGKITAWNKLYRSDGLAGLTETEWSLLTERGLRTVVDLRSLAETKAQPDAVPYGVKYVHCPVQEEDIDLDHLDKAEAESAFLRSLTEGYLSMVKKTPRLLCSALTTIIEGLRQGAVLFHCSAGKDRTGVVAAAILYLLGVDEADITADYQVSCTYNKNGVNKMFEQLMEASPERSMNLSGEKAKELLGSDAKTMETLLDCFAEIHLEEYVKAYGLTEENLRLLRKEMLTD